MNGDDRVKLSGIFDSHCHYDDHAFDDDREAVLGRLFDEDSSVCALMHAATDERSSRYGIEMSKKYENYYTSVGFHPECIDELPDDPENVLRSLLSENKKIKAVGEVGLDLHYEGSELNKQLSLLRMQISIAKEYDLPLIFHCRDATEPFLELIRETRPRGVVHCFSGSAETACELVELGMYIGFTGVLTFKNAKKAKKAFEAVPIERILLETDCPYMAPEPYRGKRCDSFMIAEIAKVGAEIKGISPQELIDAARENTGRLFSIDF